MCSKHMDGTEQIYKDLGSRVDWEDNEFHNHYDKQPKPDYGPTRYARGPCGRVCVTAVYALLRRAALSILHRHTKMYSYQR